MKQIISHCFTILTQINISCFSSVKQNIDGYFTISYHFLHI